MSRSNRIRLLVAAVTIFGVGAQCSAFEFYLPAGQPVQLRGYYKNFLFGIDSGIPQLEDGISDINRARLMLESEVVDDWEVSVHYEHIAEINPVLGGQAFFEGSDRPGLGALSWSIDSTDDLNWRHEIDRLQVHGQLGWADVTVGRQAIGWGVGLLWDPLDLLTGFSPVQIDREYRLGIDAARLLVPIGAFTEVDLVYAAYGTPFDEQVAAGRWNTTFAEQQLDIGVVVGKYFEDVVIGALAVGEIAGFGVHSSLNLTHHYGDDVGPEDFARLVVGADRRFPHDVIAVVEYYFNGWGASSPSGYLSRLTSERLQRGELYNVGRHYLGFALDWEAHPLVHLLGRGQCNLTDPSAQVGPALTVSLSDEAQLEAGVYFSLGSTLDGFALESEFGPQPDLFYTAAKIYF